jgi:hypothetical protein
MVRLETPLDADGEAWAERKMDGFRKTIPPDLGRPLLLLMELQGRDGFYVDQG